MPLYAIVGIGGHGRETMAMAQAMLDASGTDAELVFIDMPGAPVQVNGYPVISSEDFFKRPGEKLFNPAIASSQIRRKVVAEMTEAGALPFSVYAANFTNLGGNRIGQGAIFSPFTTVTVNVSIGDYFHANNYAGISHDCVIGDYVTFAPGVRCNGAVVIENDAYIGAGAIIRQSQPGRPIVIGQGATVGMGAVVTKSVAPGVTVYGNPARPGPSTTTG